MARKSLNRLSLKPGIHEPWIRPADARIKDTESVWFYCGDCHERCFPKSRHPSQVPFRDRASQCLMRGPNYTQNRTDASRAQSQHPREACRSSSQIEPEEEPQEDEEDGQGVLPIFGLRGEEHEEEPVGEEAGGNEDEVEGEDEGAEGLATEARPSLAEYMEKWASLLAQHSKAVPGPFSRDILVLDA